MKAKCRKCGDTVEVARLREYKSCKCGAIGLDYGDGYYYRVCGDPEDFEGEIEDIPQINDDLVYRPKATKIYHKIKENKMSTHRELWRNVDVAYDVESGTLDIRDSDDNDKQLGLFCVIERD
ncbi:MAG: hypothetical protein IKB64_02035 [Paludibacteraceae bacterium]|nr:hypothetical protein [Paludibacteraceae bacterium]